MHYPIAIFCNKQNCDNKEYILNRIQQYQEYGVGNDSDLILVRMGKVKNEFAYGEYNLTNINGFWDFFSIGGCWQDLQEEVHNKKIIDVKDKIVNGVYGFVDIDDNYLLREYFMNVCKDRRLVKDVSFERDLERYIENNPNLYVVIIDIHQ